MDTGFNSRKPGSVIDSWCGKCKMMLAHTIEAMVGEKPVRVHCNTCKSQHSHKPNPPGTASRQTRQRETAGGTAAPSKPRTNKYQSLLKAKDAAVAKTYSIKDKYEPGDVLDHPSFGRGVTTAVKEGSKIEVLFEGGSKTLVHGR